MKIPPKIHFHRPAFIKNSKNPLINHVFRKEKDSDNMVGNGNMDLMRRDKANRHRLFGKIIGWSKDGYSSNVINKNGTIFIQLPTVQRQFGHTCKPTALANLDSYYAAQYGIPNIPMRKNKNNLYPVQINKYTQGAPLLSVRQLAKQNDSAQGEVLQASDLVAIAKEMGYSSSVLHQSSVNEFREIVEYQILRGAPVFACFATSKGEPGDPPSGFPCVTKPENEHACLIVGIDKRKDTLIIAHWGEVYSGVKINDFYDSMNILPEVRGPEIYTKVNYDQEDRGTLKYNLVADEQATKLPPDSLVKSKTPSDYGFKSLLFVMTPDMSNERWGRTTSIHRT